MIIIAAVIAIVAVVLGEYLIYRKVMFKGLKYSAYFSSSEVCAGEMVYLYEEISNFGKFPVNCLKADTELPKGLVFTLFETEKTTPGGQTVRIGGIKNDKKDENKRKIKYEPNIQSVFLIRPGMKITRRWRVYCKTRGEYSLNGVLLTQGDVLGFLRRSKRVEPEVNRRTTLTVLPVPQNLREKYTSSRYICGDIISNQCPVTDPIRICGSRDYTPNDPMNRVNWKSTAVHGKLMVNVEEKTVRNRFSVLLNMNSKEIEFNMAVPSDRDAIERNITCCASILDRMAAEDIPVRLYYNGCSAEKKSGEWVSVDETGKKIMTSGPYRGKRDMIFALRLLAKMKMEITTPAERMFDHIAAHPELYNGDENLVVVSSYLDIRMMNMSEILAKNGVKVSFYITTSRNLIGNIPAGADVYFCNI